MGPGSMRKQKPFWERRSLGWRLSSSLGGSWMPNFLRLNREMRG
jgi:hypothetical protein